MSEKAIFDAEAGPPEARWRWTHYLRSDEARRAILSEASLPDAARHALLEENTQPRATKIGDATLLILRGVNLNPDAAPEDMISIRMAILPDRIISTEIRRLSEVSEMIKRFEADQAPASPAAFALALIALLRAEFEPVLERLEARVSTIEAHTIDRIEAGRVAKAKNTTLINMRRDAALLHRFVTPQVHALEALVRALPEWQANHPQLREETEAFRRIAADLDALRHRAEIVVEQLSLASSERTNRIMLTLSSVSVVFLPLSFLTGLFGVNLAGIPWAGEPWSFPLFAGCLILVALGAVALARRLLR